MSDSLTCTVCVKASKNNDYVSGKAHPQKGWRKEYLTRHEKSVDHRNAIKEPHLAAQVQVVYDRMLSEAGEQTVLLMKNVYFIATECIAVLKAGKLHAHVERLGIQLPHHHHRGHYSRWEFLQSMSDVLEENLLRDLLESPFCSLITDESNDLAVNKHLILYVKYLKKHEACVSFLKLLKLDTC